MICARRAGTLIVEKLDINALLPTKAIEGDLGYDLYSLEAGCIYPNDMRLVRTGIRVKFPPGFGGIFKDKSGVAYNRKLTVRAGVIDNGYRGELMILLKNEHPEGIAYFSAGDKIAQLLPVEVFEFDVEEGKVDTEETTRGQNGFGSTGDGYVVKNIPPIGKVLFKNEK